MKKLLTLLSIIAATLLTQADQIVLTVAGGSTSNIVTGPIIVDTITATAASSNITTLKFYDSPNATITYIQAATYKLARYATNFSTLVTNAQGVVFTNTFRGQATLPTAVTLATNTLPVVQTMVVPGSALRAKEVKFQTMKGLAVNANEDVVIEIDYRKNP